MDDKDVYRLQRQVEKLYRRVQREQPANAGVSMTTLCMLAALERSTDALRPSELSAELGMASSNVATALRALEAQNLVERRPDPADRRKVFIELTDHGRRVVADFHDGRYAWLQEAINAALSPRDRRVLVVAGQLMERLAEHGDAAPARLLHSDADGPMPA